MTDTPISSEINRGPGFRIKKTISRPDFKLIDEYRSFETPDISDMLNRLYSMCSDIHNIVNEEPIVGPAVTVKVFPGDNLMVHKSLDLIQPGDILVVDASGSLNNAIIGDLVASKAKHRGAAGFIIDGLIRDLPEIRKVGLPVYARGVSPIGPLHRGPGEINFTISCGGVVVDPGDIVAADLSGVVVIRKDFAAQILNKLRSKSAQQKAYISNVKKGIFSNLWVDDLLKRLDCDINE